MQSILLSWISLLVLLATTVHGGYPHPRASTPLSASSALPTKSTSSFTNSTSSPITSAPPPKLTPPPSLDDLIRPPGEKYHLTTFWECLTLAGHVDCGWHEPVLPGGTEIAAAPRVADANMAGMAAGALVVAGLLL